MCETRAASSCLLPLLLCQLREVSLGDSSGALVVVAVDESNHDCYVLLRVHHDAPSRLLLQFGVEPLNRFSQIHILLDQSPQLL